MYPNFVANPILNSQILEWLQTQDYWFQYAGQQILLHEEITPELLSATFNLFKEEYSLSDKISQFEKAAFNTSLPNAELGTSNLKLSSIKGIENVNALAKGQSIQISSSITVVYGSNGAGKSGYIRMLNNAFNSRGDKEMLKNVFAEQAGEPSCTFGFQMDNNAYELTYPRDKAHSEFSCFSVFDSTSAKIHLENDNRLNFTPSGFLFFEQVMILFEELKKCLTKEIELNKPRNPFTIHFNNSNEIQSQIAGLGPTTDEELIKSLGTFTDQDQAKLQELEKRRGELLALDIPLKLQEHRRLGNLLSEFIEKQGNIIDLFSEDKIEAYSALINSYHKLRELSRKEGMVKLAQYDILAMGSAEWRDFIAAAERYAFSLSSKEPETKEYPKEDSKCLFCLQPIGVEQNALIHAYWDMLKSEAERELHRVIQKIKDALKDLREQRLFLKKFEEGDPLFEFVQVTYPELANKWKIIVSEIRTALDYSISNLSNCNLDFPFIRLTGDTKDFNPVIRVLESKIEELLKQNTAREIGDLEIAINSLRDKSLLEKLLKQVLEFVRSHKWAAKAERTFSALRTNSITTKQGELFAEHVSEKYTTIFNRECTVLNAPTVVDLVQKNVKISTLRRLQIAGQVANKVLSEGEQRSISLADFLTEVTLNPFNRGVVFDDPVSSLDHERRDLIAKRLVELAKLRQVIVFTHDIAFLSQLRFYIDQTGDLEYSVTTLRKIGNTPGIVKAELPWIAQKLKDRIKFLRNELVRLQKLQKDGEVEEYNIHAKAWYGLLREGWERAVEERLFKGAIERFSGEIQTKRLEKVVVTEEMRRQIEGGMTQSSKWVHDQAYGLNTPIPDCKRIEEDLNCLIEFGEHCPAT